MPIDIKVDYASSLTQRERQILTAIESPVAKSVWSIRSLPRTRWSAKQDPNGRLLYCLTPYNEPTSVILYYTEDEIGRLTPEVITSDVALGRRSDLPEGFSDRHEPE